MKRKISTILVALTLLSTTPISYSKVSTTIDTDTKGLGEVVKGDIYVDVEVNTEVNLNANTSILDLAKFNIKALPYEIESITKYLKNTPEYKYGDIIDFTSNTYTMIGDYSEYEEPLISEGIIRHPSDIVHSNGDSLGNLEREHSIKFKSNTLINRTYFLSTLGRVNGNLDNILISSRLENSIIQDRNGNFVKKSGREKIEISPYQKEVQASLDIGNNIVLIDYTKGNYVITRLDNIYKPYIAALIDMKVVSESEVDCLENIKQIKGNLNSDYNLLRVNYDSIDVSEPIANIDSSKDFKWNNQVTVSSDTVKYPLYDSYNYSCNHADKNHNEYVLEGNFSSGNFRLKAQIPSLMKDESLTVIQGLHYIYKYLWYNSSEPTLNDLEVETVNSLYGLKLAGYSNEDAKVLKYLIAKGIVDPSDNLETLQKEMQYKDLVTYIYRLKYPEKRFDFKKLSLTAEDVRMASLGYSKDTIIYNTNSEMLNSELENSKRKALQIRATLDAQIGYDEIFLEIPKEELVTGNYVLTSKKSYFTKFDITPIAGDSKVYGRALIPKTYNGTLVLKSPSINGGYEIELSSWKDGGYYRIEGSKYVLSSQSRASLINMNRFASSTQTRLQVNPEKEITYFNIPIFVGEPGNRTLNPDSAIQSKFDYDGDLIIKNVTCLEELTPILSNIVEPPTTSKGEVSFMGYSQINVNGLKLTLIKSTELSKFGIEILEDNVLYNRNLDTYAYLDVRSNLLYYGNTVVKFLDNTLMVYGVEGKESTFYNLEVVKTMLRVISNDSVSNEIMTSLPNDIQYDVLDKNGILYDRFYAHKDSASGDLWLNTAMMRNKNSNFIFFRDLKNSLNLLINYRPRVLEREGQIITNNNYSNFMEYLKYSGIENHESANVLLSTILGFDGNFTNKNYRYGVTVLYRVEGGGESSEELRNLYKKTSFYSLMNLFNSPTQLKTFFGSVRKDSTFTKWKLRSDLLGEGYEEFTIEDFIDECSELVDDFIKDTIYLGLQEIGDEKEISNNLPAKIWNNNLYFRFKNFPDFSEVDNLSSPYRFLGSMNYLYNFDSKNSTFNIILEKVDYDATPSGYIPLENWNMNYNIGPYLYHDKIVLKYGNFSYMFDRIVPKDYNEIEPILIQPNKDMNNSETIEYIFNLLIKSNDTVGAALNSSILRDALKYDLELKRLFISKSIEGSTLSDPKTDSWWAKTKDFFGGILDRFKSKPIKITEKDILDKSFTMESGKKYLINQMYLYPSGTTLVKVGDTSKKLVMDGNYTLEVSPNYRPRTLIHNTYDLVNQNLAQLNSEIKNISEMKEGDLLILGSGTEMIYLGEGSFIINSPQQLQTGIPSEEILVWKYLEDLNIKVGSSLNLVNGMESISLPTYEELNSKYGTSYYELINSSKILKNSPIAFTVNNVIKTGKYKDTTIVEDNRVKANAYILPIIKLSDKISVVQIRTDNRYRGVYLLNSLNESVDGKFVDYLIDGIIDVNNKDVSIIDTDYLTVNAELLETSLIKSTLLKIKDLIEGVIRSLPIILFGYSFVSMCVLISIAHPVSRNALETLLPEEVYFFILKIFSLFSYDEYLELNFKLAFLKSFIVMAISIIWWAWFNGA